MKKYVVTSAQYGAELNTIFFDTLQQYCKLNKATLMVLPLKSKGWEKLCLNGKLNQFLVRGEVDLNDNISLNSLPIPPTNQNPLLGLDRFGTRTSQIFASPKLALKTLPNGNGNTLPRVIMTCGAVTDPFYNDSRVGHIASKDHVHAAIVVEIVDNKYYHFRQLIANDNFEITDLGLSYNGKTTKRVKPSTIVLGDWHSADIDNTVRETTIDEILPFLRPKTIALHDFFDGKSVNPHETKNIIKKAIKSNSGEDSIKYELQRCIMDLQDLSENCDDIVVVASNHDDFLKRYISDKDFVDDSENYEVGLELSLAMVRGAKNPVETYVKYYGGFGVENVKFLSRDESFKKCGFELANHGEVGVGGSKGNIQSQEKISYKAIIGHSHSPSILRNIVCVGTCTPLSLSYTKGGTSWMNSHAVVYEDGTVQLINIIDGRWKA